MIDLDKLIVGETFILIVNTWALYLGPGRKKKDHLSVAWQGRILQAPVNKMTDTMSYDEETKDEKDTIDILV